jgi:hypothetical protein
VLWSYLSAQAGAILRNEFEAILNMWGAIIASMATVTVVLYMRGPIIALALTAVCSLALLVVMKIEERRMPEPNRHQKLQMIDGKTEVDLLFPPFERRAS